jgi:2-hydroxychromene-2-carboxylate isomerase
MALAVRTALFEDGRHLADPDVIADLARAHGIDDPGPAAAAAVAADYAEGRRRNVLGSPEFILGDRSYFCPALQIQRTGDVVVINLDTERFEAFIADCFRP